jgi:stage V sporulation protein AD
LVQKRLGNQSVAFSNPPSIIGYASVVGKKEGEGPLKRHFDIINDDSFFGENTWEKAESQMQKTAYYAALNKAKKTSSEIDYIVAGDLLNQCIGSTFGLKESNVPFWGIYGACSTMAESICLGSMMLDGGFAENVVAITSSHFCSAERQFRYPLEYGGQRTPTAQWTVTGSGAVVLSASGAGPYVTGITAGKIVDAGIIDANNMGAAMAPAAYDTLSEHFKDFGTQPSDYDLIVTGDLGLIGSEILVDFFNKDGLNLSPYYNDCGMLIYAREEQDVPAGASGCGCCASVLTGYILNGMRDRKWNKVLFAATGAMLSTVSTQQGESIPCICYAAVISNDK